MEEKVGWTETELLTLSNKITDGSHNPPPKSEFGEPMLSAQNIYDDKILILLYFRDVFISSFLITDIYAYI